MQVLKYFKEETPFVRIGKIEAEIADIWLGAEAASRGVGR